MKHFITCRIYSLWWWRTAIPDDAFRHLSTLQSLNLRHCNQSRITDKAFHHLSTVQSLATALGRRCTFCFTGTWALRLYSKTIIFWEELSKNNLDTYGYGGWFPKAPNDNYRMIYACFTRRRPRPFSDIYPGIDLDPLETTHSFHPENTDSTGCFDHGRNIRPIYRTK